MRFALFLLTLALACPGMETLIIKDPATANSLGASATVLNTLTPTFTRETGAWDPLNNVITQSGVQRTRPQIIGTTSYNMTLIEKQAVNGLTPGTSERFDRWTTTGTLTVTADAAAAPDGDVIAQTINDTDAAVISSVSQALAITSSANTIPCSIYVKKTSGGTAPTFGFTAALSGGTPTSVVARINTDTGAQQYGSNAQTAIVNASTNYWRVCLLPVDNASGNTTLTLSVLPAASAFGASVDSAAATGTATCTFAEKENASSASTFTNSYVSNRNLLLRTQELATTWTATRCSITSDSTANPVNAIVNADTIVEDATATNTHFITQSFTKATSSIQMTYSTYLLQGSRTWAFVQCSDNAAVASGNGIGLYVNLATGAAGSTVAVGAGWTLDNSHIVAVGSWWRIDETVTTNTANSIRPKVCAATGDGGVIYSGASSNSLFCWGNQLVYGAKPQNYWAISTTNGRRDTDNLLSTATFSTTAATFVVIGRPLGWSTTQTAYKLLSTNPADSLGINRNDASSLQFVRTDAGGTEQVLPSYTGFSDGANSTLGMTYDSNAVTAYISGTNVGSDNTLTPPYVAVSAIGIGYSASSGTSAFCGYVLGFYWPTALPPSSMQIFANGVAP